MNATRVALRLGKQPWVHVGRAVGYPVSGARCISSTVTAQAESVTKMVRSIKKKKFPSGRLKVGPKPAHLGPKSPKSDNRAAAAALEAVEEEEDGAGEAAANEDAVGNEEDEELAHDAEEEYDDDEEDEEEVTVEEVVLSVAEEIKGEGNVTIESALDDINFKSEFLTMCLEEFEKGIPSATLNRLNTVGDVVSYFEEPLPEHGSLRPSDKPLFYDIDMEALPSNLSIDVIDREPHIRPNF